MDNRSIPEPQPQDQSPGMPWPRFRSVVAGRLPTFLAMLFTVVALAVVATRLMPPSYVASAQLLVEARTSASGQPVVSPIATEAEILESERVALQVVRTLELHQDAELHRRWQAAADRGGSFEQWAVQELLRQLGVKPSRDSNILTISYSAPRAEDAARTVQAFVEAYIRTTAEIRQERASQSSQSFSGRTRDLKAALDTAASRLDTFQRENGVASTDERLDVEMLRLSELNAQLVSLQASAVNAAGRQRAASANRGAMEEVLRDPLVAALSIDLERQESRVTELQARAGEANPALVEQRASLQSIRRRLEAARERASSSIVSDSRIAADRVAATQAALDAQRSRVMQVKARRDQALRLQQELDLARKSYDAAVTRSHDSVLDSGASRGSVSVVKAATVPARAAFPKPMVNVAAALFLGIVLGLATVFWKESRDRRLRLERDVGEWLAQPLLGALTAAPAHRIGWNRSIP